MTSVLVALPVLIPLTAAGLVLVVGGRQRARLTTMVALAATTVVSFVVLGAVERHGHVVHHIGGWSPPLGISLVADLTSALFLSISMIVVALVWLFSVGQGVDHGRSAVFHAVYLILTAGVALSFVTGDLFNLFVAFEMMLIASYVLMTIRASGSHLQPAMTYVVINVVASTMFLAGVALIYGATGTVNLAQLVERFNALPESTRTGIGVLLLAVFATKAALFPLFFWLPDSYPAAPTAVTAVFAGLLTKVGIYAMIRINTLFGFEHLRPVILGVAMATMVIGAIGAVAQDDIKRILSFHIISQVGYMVMGLGLATSIGLAGTVFYVVHHIPVKASLFCVAGLVEERTGTGALHRLGGLLHRAPVIAWLFALPALSLAGLPPFSGFLAKLSLVRAGLDDGQWWVVAVSLVAGLLTLLSMSKIWAGVFWGEPDEPAPHWRDRSPRLMIGATVALVAVTLAIPIVAGALHSLSERAAGQLLDPAAYARAVLGGGR